MTNKFTKLRELYRGIPEVECVENCGLCCGLIVYSRVEHENMKNYIKRNKVEPVAHKDKLICQYLSKEDKCLIYPVRPMICRLYGVVEGELVCPKDAKVKGKKLTDTEASRLLRMVTKI